MGVSKPSSSEVYKLKPLPQNCTGITVSYSTVQTELCGKMVAAGVIIIIICGISMCNVTKARRPDMIIIYKKNLHND